MTKPMANGTNHLPKAVRIADGAVRTGIARRRASQGSITSENSRRPAPTIAVMVKSSGQRVSSASSLRILETVNRPISGRNRPKASSAVIPASRNARGTSTRSLCAPLISHLFDVRPAEQALRQEDQRDGQHGECGDVLVVDGKIR